MLWTVPNLLTLLRVALIPVIVLLYCLPIDGVYAATVFLLAGLTDWLDGYLARSLAQSSRFGEFLDPVADKLMVVVALVLLVSDQGLADRLLVPLIFTLVSAVVIGREIAISALREWMAEMGERGVVAVGYLGKIKTTIQIIAITLLLSKDDLGYLPSLVVGEILFYAAGGLTLWSMARYLRAAWPVLLDRSK
ncbi:MAG: CDP-diacylglycerol--glycerol-3-phosphate 3-phosphatidyltransferase [Pseudomonadota bacterium]|nr:CDP-diacylglycerol--glycerol-3-phosphate 3-phosphatidyltransferase [Pseudomonadota bacterium]MED5407455.1 CDP-diacylglycerol--glycerol-3-phosphate 3-phosphatidyltransferase [Pseudomonadota bacterium]